MTDTKQGFQTIRKGLSQIHTKYDSSKNYIIDRSNCVEVWGLPSNIDSSEVKAMLAERWITEGLKELESFITKNSSDVVVVNVFEVIFKREEIAIFIWKGKDCFRLGAKKNGTRSFWYSSNTISAEEAAVLLSR